MLLERIVMHFQIKSDREFCFSHKDISSSRSNQFHGVNSLSVPGGGGGTTTGSLLTEDENTSNSSSDDADDDGPKHNGTLNYVLPPCHEKSCILKNLAFSPDFI